MNRDSASPGREIVADFAIDRPVVCDHTRIGQLLSNLVGDALTHEAHPASPSSSMPVPETDRALGRQRRRTDTGSVYAEAIRGVLSRRGAREPARTGAGTVHCLSDRSGARRYADRGVHAGADPLYLHDALKIVLTRSALFRKHTGHRGLANVGRKKGSPTPRAAPTRNSRSYSTPDSWRMPPSGKATSMGPSSRKPSMRR